MSKTNLGVRHWVAVPHYVSPSNLNTILTDGCLLYSGVVEAKLRLCGLDRIYCVHLNFIDIVHNAFNLRDSTHPAPGWWRLGETVRIPWSLSKTYLEQDTLLWVP